MHNLDGSIASFARVCFDYALDTKQDLWFATKDTISKNTTTVSKIFSRRFSKRNTRIALTRQVSNILHPDRRRRIASHPLQGGFIWACKNYDGDVMSDMVATAFGSLGMMTSVLVSPDGAYEYEAAHGTVTRHYYKYLKGEKNLDQPHCNYFCLERRSERKRGELDSLPELCRFADVLEQACKDTIEDGVMTGDLAALSTPGGKTRGRF